MRIEITKDNWRKFTKSALGIEKKGSQLYSESREALDRNKELLDVCAGFYNSLQSFREKRDECVNYYLGKQLDRLVPDPERSGESPVMIPIREYAIKQGMTPLQMNLVTSRIRSMVGLYEKQKLEDLAIARDGDKQTLGEMVSAAMQYAYQHSNLYRANADGYREFLIGALPVFRTGFDFDHEKKISDVYAEMDDVNMMFWDDNTSGQYFKHISLIGRLHEFSQLDTLQRYAKTPAMRKAILDAFAEVHHAYPSQQFRNDPNKNLYSFYTPKDHNKYRVIEVWRKEQREAYVCNDPLDTTPFVIDVEDLQQVLAENERRKVQIHMYGGNPEDAATIDYEYRVTSVWMVRFLTPCGHVLYEAESPYAHGSHPWAIGGYPMINGVVQSLVSDLEPIQDLLNRLLMRSEFIRMNQAKGFGIVELEALEDSDLTEDEFARKYTSPKGIVALRCAKYGGANQVFARFTDEGGTSSDMQMMATCIDIINQQSGSTDASRGEQGGSHESASRYMMETENSSNNTCDGEQWYNGLILIRDWKLMNLMQQYYDTDRYLAVAGGKYSEEAKNYKAAKIKQTQFDLALIQQPSTAAVRLMMNDTINTLLQYQAIDGNTAVEALDMYGMSDIRRIKKRNDEAAAQAMMQQQAAAGAPVEQQMQ